MRSTIFFSVLGLALGVAGGGSMRASTIFSGTITPTNQEADIYFVYSATGPDGPVSGAISLGSDPLPGVGVPFMKMVSGYITSGSATLLGVYSPTLMSATVLPENIPTTPTVSVIVNSGEAATDTGMGWDSVFTNGPDEATIENDLISGNTTDLISFLTGNSSHFLSYSDMTTGDSGTILNFSNATVGGSATLNVMSTPDSPASVPEPSSAWLVLGGVGLFGLNKLKRA